MLNYNHDSTKALDVSVVYKTVFIWVFSNYFTETDPMCTNTIQYADQSASGLISPLPQISDVDTGI